MFSLYLQQNGVTIGINSWQNNSAPIRKPPPTHCLFKHNSVMSPASPNTPHRRMIYSNHFIDHIGFNFQIHIGNYMGKCGNLATQEIVLQITYFHRYCYYYCLFLISFITYGVSQFIIVLPLHLLSYCMFNTPPPYLYTIEVTRMTMFL